jgi:hypothetical protein
VITQRQVVVLFFSFSSSIPKLLLSSENASNSSSFFLQTLLNLTQLSTSSSSSTYDQLLSSNSTQSLTTFINHLHPISASKPNSNRFYLLSELPTARKDRKIIAKRIPEKYFFDFFPLELIEMIRS